MQDQIDHLTKLEQITSNTIVNYEIKLKPTPPRIEDDILEVLDILNYMNGMFERLSDVLLQDNKNMYIKIKNIEKRYK